MNSPQKRSGTTAGKPEGIQVLLLEPDHWRFLGMCYTIDASGCARVIGEQEYARILTLDTSPPLDPRVILLSHKLVLDYGISIIAHLKDLFHEASILVIGEDDRLETAASVLAVGALGFFLLSAPPRYLLSAIGVVAQKKIWGPREAVALMARRAKENPDEPAAPRASSVEDQTILLMLAEGLSNKEVGSRLGLAEVTIKARMTRLYKQFGVKTRLQLLTSAIRLGMLEPSVKPASGGEESE